MRGRVRFEARAVIFLFPVGLIAWLTIGAAFMLTSRHVASRLPPQVPGTLIPGGRPPLGSGPAWTRWAPRFAGVTAAALIVVASWLGVVPRVPSSLHDAPLVREVCASSTQIERALPRQPLVLSVVGTGRYTRHRLTTALVWALTGAGYHIQPRPRPPRSRPPQATVRLHGTIAVDVYVKPHDHPMTYRSGDAWRRSGR